MEAVLITLLIISALIITGLGMMIHHLTLDTSTSSINGQKGDKADGEACHLSIEYAEPLIMEKEGTVFNSMICTDKESLGMEIAIKGKDSKANVVHLSQQEAKKLKRQLECFLQLTKKR